MKNSLLKGLVILGAILSFGMAQAQTVTGTVSDANGPLAGANVLVKGTTNGTQTDFDGNYTLNNVASDAVLVFSYIGFKTQEIAVNGRSSINATLVEDANELDEVVIIGYGQVRKRDATGAVESIKAEEFNKGVIVNPQELIQGKTAGVQITQTSGEPGAAINVRIRGTASVRSNNNPLYVVDGVPLSGGNTSAGTGGGNTDIGSAAPLDPLSFLNPNDIASIDILKDASATAIYGSRGANGVVIITTKRGTSGKGVLEFSSSFSVGYVPNQYDLLDVDGFLAAQNALGATGQDFGARNDFQDEIFRTSFTQNYNLAYGAGNETGNYRLSFQYQDQQGEVENSNFDRLTARINANQRFFNNRLRFDTQATISNIEAVRPPIADDPNARGDLLSSVFAFNPTRPIFNDDGSFNQPTFETRNPLAVLGLTRNVSSTLRALVNFGTEVQITDDLKFRNAIGVDKSTSSAGSAISSLFNSAPTLGVGRATLNEVDLTNLTWEAFFNYNKTFNDNNLDLTLGYSYQEFVTEGIFLAAAQFRTENLGQMLNNLASAESFAADTFLTRDELQSFFFRGNYSHKSKYIFTGTLRIDGSSRFGSNNRYGVFPALAGAWQLSEEDWFPEVFSNFKFRVAWGITGNQEGLGSNNFSDRERFFAAGLDNPGNRVGGGIGAVAFENDDLQWEENEQYNIGVDFGFLNNRITGSLEYYNRTTSEFLLQLNSAQPAVNPFVFTNIDGDIVNQGVELNFNFDAIQNDNFNWSFNVNAGYNDNEVTRYDGPRIDTGAINGPGLTGAFAQAIEEGQPLFSFFVRDFQGLDENGNNIFANNGQQVFVGESALPDVTLGISHNLSYKNWDLSLFFNSQIGQSVYSNNRNAFFTIGNLSQGRNVTSDVVSSIGVENPFNPAEVSTRFLEDASFLRLQTLNLGYNFNLPETSIFSSLRTFVNAQNLFVITGYSGQDPEVSINRAINGVPSLGIDLTAFPRPTTITFGFNATF